MIQNPLAHPALYAVFGAVYALTGDPKEASAAVGRGFRWGQALLTTVPEVEGAITSTKARHPELAPLDPNRQPLDWKALHPLARIALEDVLRDPKAETRDRLQAAMHVIERAEGKTPVRLDHDPEDGELALMGTVFWRLVWSLHVARGMELEAAERWANENPDKVREWGVTQGLLAPKALDPANEVRGDH